MNNKNIENNKQLDDLQIQLIMNNNCNLWCEYCILKEKYNKKNKNVEIISDETIEKLIEIFNNISSEEFKKYYKKINILFFWWEPLMSQKKLIKIIKWLYKLDFINFIIHTNWLLITKNFLNELNFLDKNKYFFVFSIDWNIDTMLKYRLRTKREFNLIINNIKLLREKEIDYSFNSLISYKSSEKIKEDLLFLKSLNPKENSIHFIDLYYKWWLSNLQLKTILKWVKKTFDYFKKYEKNDFNLIQYFWLPKNINNYDKYIKLWWWFSFVLDMNWKIYLENFWVDNLFDNKLTKEERNTLYVGSIFDWNIKFLQYIGDFEWNIKNEEKLEKIVNKVCKNDMRDRYIFSKFVINYNKKYYMNYNKKYYMN